MKPIIMSASDRRELLQLLQDQHGSKSAAAAVVNGLTADGQKSLLIQLRSNRFGRVVQRPSSLGSSQVPSVSSQVVKRAKRAKKVPYSLLISQDDLDSLRSLADQQDVAVSHLIRQAIKHALKGRIT